MCKERWTLLGLRRKLLVNQDTPRLIEPEKFGTKRKKSKKDQDGNGNINILSKLHYTYIFNLTSVGA